MARWRKQIPVNAIVGKANDLTEVNPLLRRNEDFLQIVALHLVELCAHDGWDPGVDEWDCESITHIDDFDTLLSIIYDKADADLVWTGMDGDAIPKFHTNHPRVGWLGDFSAFAPAKAEVNDGS